MPKRRQGRTAKRRLSLEALERREALAVASIEVLGSSLVITADGDATSVTVRQAGQSLVVSEAGGGSWSFDAGLLGSVQFLGGGGDDRFAASGVYLSVTAHGGGGNDVLVGGNGHDSLNGGMGDDRLNGGGGADRLAGGEGDDLLIALDSATGDSLDGEAGQDTLWIDRNAAASDLVLADALDKTQRIDRFANTADRTLDGDNIADLRLRGSQTYRRFANQPLFSSAGPQSDDITQGILADCWLLAGLSAIAQDSPATLRQNVVEFDDGTYGVALGAKFYRVDADLAVSNKTATTPVYAGLGREGSLWVAVVEKAYAHFRGGTKGYAALGGGWSIEVNRAFGSTAAGEKVLSSYASAAALGEEIARRLENQESATIGIMSVRPRFVGTAPLVLAHMYTVISVTRDSAGAVAGITLRNPWGVDGKGQDGSPNDGQVTVTPTQLVAYVGRVNWGRV